MRSVGINLGQYIKKGLLGFHAWRPSQHGLEMHLLRIHDLVDDFNPQVVIVDPITNLISANLNEVHAMLMRLLDFLKDRQITAMFTTLTANRGAEEQTEVGISSLTDTWILLRDLELNGERNRCLYVLKSRGMAHSNQIREFVLSRTGSPLTSRLRWIWDRLHWFSAPCTGSSRKSRVAARAAAVGGEAQRIFRQT